MLAVQRCTSAILRFTFLRSSAENTALATTNWGWVIRSAAQHLEDLRIKNATPLTKRALAPLISSNHVSSCICNTSEIVRLPWQMCLLETCFKCPTPANVFDSVPNPGFSLITLAEVQNTLRLSRETSFGRWNMALAWVNLSLLCQNRIRATTRSNFSTSQLQKWLGTAIFDLEPASCHNGKQFLLTSLQLISPPPPLQRATLSSHGSHKTLKTTAFRTFASFLRTFASLLISPSSSPCYLFLLTGGGAPVHRSEVKLLNFLWSDKRLKGEQGGPLLTIIQHNVCESKSLQAWSARRCLEAWTSSACWRWWRPSTWILRGEWGTTHGTWLISLISTPSARGWTFGSRHAQRSPLPPCFKRFGAGLAVCSVASICCACSHSRPSVLWNKYFELLNHWPFQDLHGDCWPFCLRGRPKGVRVKQRAMAFKQPRPWQLQARGQHFSWNCSELRCVLHSFSCHAGVFTQRLCVMWVLGPLCI